MDRPTSRILIPFLAVFLCGPTSAQVTRRISVATGGAQGDGLAGFLRAAISSNGRYVAFSDDSTNLVAGDTNACRDIFVRDRVNETTERVSVGAGGVEGDQPALDCSMSADGRYVAFASYATNLVAGDTNNRSDVFVRDRQSGTTIRVSVDSGAVQANNDSSEVSLSADGRFVAFLSYASNLVAGDTNADGDVFVRDLVAGVTTRASVDSGGLEGNVWSFRPSISADGRYVAFISLATNLVPADTNASFDAFVRDRTAGTTERVSVSSGGVEASLGVITANVPISGDGRFVGFSSDASNLVPGDTNGFSDGFLRDRQLATTERVSLTSAGMQGNSSSLAWTVSDDGRFVAFESVATNLVPVDSNANTDAFVRDRQTATTQLVSLASSGAQALGGPSAIPVLTPDGRFVEFLSSATNLVPGDTNGLQDEFVRDRAASGFQSLCDPGVGGVLPCPCSNPPGGLGRGCNNSSATGGAVLTAAGAAYLGADSLVFTTSGERPTALSIVTQWLAPNAAGAVFGMGVRCTSGTFKRLYNKSASGGSITAPNFGSGDPSVSARSAALGDSILAGQSRWYFVFYRDPNVLGGCPSTSTFNATQTGQVSWWP